MGLNIQKFTVYPEHLALRYRTWIFLVRVFSFKEGQSIYTHIQFQLRTFHMALRRTSPGVRAFLVFLFQRAECRRSVVCSHEQWQQSPRAVTFKHTMLVNRHAYNGLSQSPYHWEGIKRYDPRYNLNNKEQAGALFFEHVMNASAIVLILSRWWFQFFLVSPLSGEIIQFD